MEITDGNKKYLSPNLTSEKIEFSIENVNRLIGLDLKEKDIIKLLEKMNIGFLKEKDTCYALIPPYRTDILHEVDIIEDIVIAYGYENLVPEIPKISTIGQEDKISILKRKISEILTGTGLLETSTFHLSTKEKQFKNIGIKDFKDDMIEVIDSKTENNILRASLLAQNIMILGINPDVSYPQKIYELGKVFHNNEKSETGITEKERLCVSLCHDKSNFTDAKQILDYLMRMLSIKYNIIESEHPCYIQGRCGEIIVNKKSIGFIGELAPFILRNNKIKMPVASFEIDIIELLK
jgi:phenylalanyl-tRNA synthetase beta chain